MLASRRTRARVAFQVGDWDTRDSREFRVESETAHRGLSAETESSPLPRLRERKNRKARPRGEHLQRTGTTRRNSHTLSSSLEESRANDTRFSSELSSRKRKGFVARIGRKNVEVPTCASTGGIDSRLSSFVKLVSRSRVPLKLPMWSRSSVCLKSRETARASLRALEIVRTSRDSSSTTLSKLKSGIPETFYLSSGASPTKRVAGVDVARKARKSVSRARFKSE